MAALAASTQGDQVASFASTHSATTSSSARFFSTISKIIAFWAALPMEMTSISLWAPGHFVATSLFTILSTDACWKPQAEPFDWPDSSTHSPSAGVPGHPVELVGREEPVRLPEHHEHRLLGRDRALQLRDHRALRAAGDRLERQADHGDHVLRPRAPVGRVRDQTAFREGVRGRERLGAVIERLVARQSRALVVHVGRIDPAFLGLESELAEHHDVPALHRLRIDVADVVGPDLGLQVDVALGDGRELRYRTGRDVLDRVADLLKQISGDVSRDVLAGPLVDRDLDRLVGIRPRAGDRNEGDECRRDSSIQ